MSCDTLVVPIDEVISAHEEELTYQQQQQEIVVVSKPQQQEEQQTTILTTTTAPQTVIVHEQVLRDEEDPHVVVESILPDDAEISEDAMDMGLDMTEVVLEEAANASLEQDNNAQAGNGIGSDFFVGDATEETVIQLKEEEVIETPADIESQEMSVAMEMAKLSQQGQFVTEGQFYEEYMNNSNHSDSENTTPPPHIPSLVTPPAGEKPRLSYAQMIAEALMSRDDRMLTLSDIYQAISRRYPYYRMDVKSWQNAIRHNLTLNPSFTKVPRPNNEGRGNYWRMEDGAEKQIFRRQIRNQQALERKANQAAMAKQRKHPPQQAQPTKQIVVNDDGSVVETTVVYPPGTAVIGSTGQTVQILQQNQIVSSSSSIGQGVQVLQNIEPSQIVQQNGSIVFIALPASKTVQASNA